MNVWHKTESNELTRGADAALKLMNEVVQIHSQALTLRDSFVKGSVAYHQAEQYAKQIGTCFQNIDTDQQAARSIAAAFAAR